MQGLCTCIHNEAGKQKVHSSGLPRPLHKRGREEKRGGGTARGKGTLLLAWVLTQTGEGFVAAVNHNTSAIVYSQVGQGRMAQKVRGRGGHC